MSCMSPVRKDQCERDEAVLDAMRERGSASARATLMNFQPLSGGFSRQMYRADVVDPLNGIIEIVVCVRHSNSLLDSSLDQEYAIYQALANSGVPLPSMHGKCNDVDTALGGPFFVMDRLPGVAPNVWRVTDRHELEDNWRTTRALGEDVVAAMSAIHCVDTAPLEGVVQRMSFAEVVAHWRTTYERVRLIRDPIIDEAFDWVHSRTPAPVPESLVHGDFRIGNCLVNEGRLSGVLDWELAYLGDPRFDVGYLALGYSSGKLVKPGSALLGAVAERDWFFGRYQELTGRAVDLEDVRTFSVLSALMLMANLSSAIHTYVERGADDIRMLWSRVPIASLRLDLVRLMEWPEAGSRS